MSAKPPIDQTIDDVSRKIRELQNLLNGLYAFKNAQNVPRRTKQPAKNAKTMPLATAMAADQFPLTKG